MAWAGGFKENYTRDQFAKMVEATKFDEGWTPTFVTLHHCGAPSVHQWEAPYKDTGKPYPLAQRQKNLEHEYRNNQGWSSAPHLFIAPESPVSYWQGTPLNRQGVHAVSFNKKSIGLEMVGNFDVDKFDERVRDNTAFALAVLFRKIGSQPAPYVFNKSGLHFHRDDPKTTKTCPGKKVEKADMIARVEAEMAKLDGKQPSDKPAEPTEHIGVVTGVKAGDFLFIRPEAALVTESLGKLNPGDRFTILGEAGNWLNIRTAAGVEGWVAERYVKAA